MTMTNTIKVNIDVIEKIVLESYPTNIRQAEVYSMMTHDTETRFVDQIHTIIKAVKDMELLELSPNKIITAMLINMC